MSALIQLAVLVVFTAGLGYWVWLWARKPSPMRACTWLWCGLAGFSLGLLLLQALVYLDLPLRKTAPFLWVIAGGGFALLAIGLLRTRSDVAHGRKWREIAFVLGAGAGAGLVHSTSLMGIGSDRFLGHAQVDHVNYVMMAQFMADEPFSTDLHGIGLRPWLWHPMEWKSLRITECVALGAVGVLSGSDAQRAWGATSVFFTILLALALAGMWRVIGAMPGWAAGWLGLVGAAIPVVTHVYLIGFFSQLTALFVFPALIAVCRAGALPRGLAMVLAACLLGFLAGTYTEFWPIGIGVAGGSMLWWPIRLWRRIAAAVVTTAGSLLLTGAYMEFVPAALFSRVRGLSEVADALAGFVPDGISWLGWGRNFFAGSSPWLDGAGMLVAGGMVLGLVLQPAHRRWLWAAALAGPGLLAAYFLLAPQAPVYATYKLLATFSPICLGLATWGLARMASRLGRGPRQLVVGLLGLGGGLAICSAVIAHLELVQASHHANRELLERLWAVRDRVERSPATYLMENGNYRIGAWLTYFARASNVYYDLPALSDRRVPSESAPFRKIPAGVRLEWLDLDRSGPVPPREPSPGLSLQGARSSFEQAQRTVYILGDYSELVLIRSAGFAPQEREFVLECGLTPLPGAGPCRVVLSDQHGPVSEFNLEASRSLSVRLRATPGRNVYSLRAHPVARGAGFTGAEKDLIMLQALSLERVGTVVR